MSGSLQIMIAWTEDGAEFVSERRTDLGERPVMRPVKIAKCAAWRYQGTVEDIAKAKAYLANPASVEGAVVYVYPSSVADPREQARADVLAGKPGR